jgi:hypothetical protein
VKCPIAGKFAVVLDGLFSPEEMQEWIDLTEKTGYEEALINVGLATLNCIHAA